MQQKYSEIIGNDFINCRQIIVETDNDSFNIDKLLSILKNLQGDKTYIRLFPPFSNLTEPICYREREDIIKALNEKGYQFETYPINKKNWIYQFYIDNKNNVILCFSFYHKLYEEFSELHNSLVNQIIQFMKEHNVQAEEVHLSADNLNESVKYGEWCPSTDSCLELFNRDFIEETKTVLLNC